MTKGRGHVCNVCHDTKRRPAIDTALLQGSTVTDVARRFAMTHESVRRHARNHLGIAGRTGIVAQAKTPPATSPIDQIVRLVAPKAIEDAPIDKLATPRKLTPISLRTPNDVLSALEIALAETQEMMDQAGDAGDSRLRKDLLNTKHAILDKAAKSAGLYNDGAVVNVNPVDQKIVAVVSDMSVDDLRAYMQKASASG